VFAQALVVMADGAKELTFPGILSAQEETKQGANVRGVGRNEKEAPESAKINGERGQIRKRGVCERIVFIFSFFFPPLA